MWVRGRYDLSHRGPVWNGIDPTEEPLLAVEERRDDVKAWVEFTVKKVC